ncbi:MAG TPA: glycogen debranching N-terminal domain-containing protein [Terriglobales bacterium]|nr:glycogen debranching N-terminal domain-containing protein [Terriglobales bacterium]
MSTSIKTPDKLIPVPSPYGEHREFQVLGPRKMDNLTLIDGKTFLSTRTAGDIAPAGSPDVGFFHNDTRFLSFMEMRVGGARTVLLSCNTEKTFLSQIELTTSNIHLRESFDLPENTIHIRREQMLSFDALFERLSFANFNLNPVQFRVDIEYDADFVDVFQVRGMGRNSHGQYYQPIVNDGSLEFVYQGRDDIIRQTRIEFDPPPARIEGQIASWELTLPSLQQVEINIRVTALTQGERPALREGDFNAQLHRRRKKFADWESNATRFRSSDDALNTAFRNATSDFHALQIPEGPNHVIAAGIPWFATMFGRDSIIAAYQSLVLNPQLAVETLRILARRQGDKYDDWHDEEPGKILHEYREGEMTRSGEMPFGSYYGTIDATPLFLILLSETWNWTADQELVQELLPAAYKALDWIDKYGDLDGDGFVEYLRRSKRGLANQGWKDSWDANIHRDGTVARPPIALVEVQGYVYDAKYRMASLLRAFGDSVRADQLKKEASDLAKRFEKAFWMPQHSFYAMALDADKKPLEVISSNPGHLLFTRIIARERARAVVNRLMRNDMFSGWGWRTMSCEEKVFNPLSYHRGSVWPHDNSLIAHGMALNEFREPVKRLFTTLWQAALTFRDYRLPELFCGIQRREHDVPVHYPVSCSPQAWASGALFLILSSLLGIRPSAPRKVLNIVNPQLPEWLDHVHIRNLRIGNCRVGLDFTRRGERTFCNVVEVQGDKLEVDVVFKK